MGKFDIFQQQVPVGSVVALRLTRGSDLTGTVTEVGEAHVCVKVGEHIATIFEDILAGWEVFPDLPAAEVADGGIGGVALSEADPSAPQVSTVPVSGHIHNASGITTRETITARRAAIDASFAEGLKRAQLELPVPDFSVPEGDLSRADVARVRRDLDKARNQYHYALKIREESRLSSIVRQVIEPLVQDYPRSAALRATLGSLLLRLGNLPEAAGHLRLAAAASGEPAHWLLLAYAGQGSATECFALRNYLLRTDSDQTSDAWLRYIRLALTHGDGEGLLQVLESCLSLDSTHPASQRAVEGLVYVLGQIDADDVANDVVEASMHGAPLPERWRELVSQGLGRASDELANEQRRQNTPDTPSGVASDVPMGRIVSFGSQRFGFIESSSRETYFFGINDVIDDRLRDELLGGVWKNKVVEFRLIPSPGHRYSRAADVMTFEDADTLLLKARSLASRRQYPQAMSMVRRVLAVRPTHSAARKYESELRQEMKKGLASGVGLPKGTGPFARAKRAQLVDQDLSKAERLFREAIDRGDNAESAINDLTYLLQQTGRGDEAVALLQEKRKTYPGTSSYDNALATMLQAIGRYEEAIHILTELLARATFKRRRDLLRSIAFCQFKLERYDEAEATLEELLQVQPDDPSAQRWLAGLQRARDSGSYAEAIELIDSAGNLAEEGLDLTPLAEAAIEECSFEGVDPVKLEAGALTIKDADRLEELAKELGTKRPRDRAAYYLSAAAILARHRTEEGGERIYDYLRRYFASMGDSAWLAKQPADVARTYYAESLALVSEEGKEPWNTLLRYLVTYVPNRHSGVEQSIRSTRKYSEIVFELVDAIAGDTPNVLLDALMSVSSDSKFASRALMAAVGKCSEAREVVSSQIRAASDRADAAGFDLNEEWARCSRANIAFRNETDALCRTMSRHILTTASMEDLTSQLDGIPRDRLSELDRRRLVELLGIAESALRFCRVSDFEEKERQYWLTTSRAKQFRDDVVASPTRFAHASLLPVSEHLRSLTEEQYAQLSLTSAAHLDVRLLVDHYVRDNQGELRLQFEITNRRGCSPASTVSLVIGPQASPHFVSLGGEVEVASTIRGGSGMVAHVKVRLLPTAEDQPAFPITVRAKYVSSAGELSWTEESQWTVRLYPEQDFVTIDNPYSPYAEGGPVDDPKMFVGREALLGDLSCSLLSGSAGKCIVMFGQKRAGKSSVLEHLRRRLLSVQGCLPVQFSLYEIGPQLDEAAFFFTILRSIHNALDDQRGTWSEFRLECPTLEELKEYPAMKFHAAMRSIVGARPLAGAEPLILVLLIDEFTEIFKQIKKTAIRPEFMKAWKAVVEKRYFASVLVGQDIMPMFKADFPNEFGVTEDVRITYLPEPEARRLITEPIGVDHYIGKAVDRIMGLTAGSPFYTMMFCSRLVDYMNRTRSAVVTEADIAMVAHQLVTGDKRLTKDKFDNLISAGDGMLDSGINPDDTLRICRQIALGSQNGWCSGSILRSYDQDLAEVLLADLERRDVVERKEDAYRLRVGLFSDWLLAQG